MNSYPALSGGFCHSLLRPFRWYHRTEDLTWHVFFPSGWQVIRDSSGWRCFLHTQKKNNPRGFLLEFLEFLALTKKSLSDTFFFWGGGETRCRQKKGGRKKRRPSRNFGPPTQQRRSVDLRMEGCPWCLGELEWFTRCPAVRGQPSRQDAIVAGSRFAVGIPEAKHGEILVVTSQHPGWGVVPFFFLFWGISSR